MYTQPTKKLHSACFVLAFMMVSALPALADEALKKDSSPSTASPAPQASPEGGEQVNVDTIKQKYWAQGNESELGVVQNRLYSKERKFELGLLGGMITSDPFLTIRSAGLTLGYHFSEYLAVHGLWWHSYVSPSSALVTFEEIMHATTNTNDPHAYAGGELSASVIYGKLSLLGKAIIYYDLHLLGGLGITMTENGNYLTPHLGIGQQIYLNKSLSFRIDYRLMRYNEEIREKVVPQKLGELRGERINWSNSISVGLDFLFEVF